MDLVTVTYFDEKDLIIRQAKSINKFVENRINHVIVIQDDALPINEWYKILKPLYTRHNLKLHYNNGTLKEYGGWIQSLQLKYTASEYVETEYYLILDSKNFFCKLTNLDNWPITEGSGQANPGEWTHQFIKFFAGQINRPIPRLISNNITPYRVKTDTVRSMLKEFNFNDIIEKFYKAYPTESESGSIMYDFFGEKIEFLDEPEQLPFITVWNGQPVLTSKYLTGIDNTSHIKIFGVHKEHKQSAKSMKAFYKWCKRLGI